MSVETRDENAYINIGEGASLSRGTAYPRKQHQKWIKREEVTGRQNTKIYKMQV